MRIILASKSPRRIELLHTIIPNFEIIPSNFNENKIKEKDPVKLSNLLAISKVEDVFLEQNKISKDEDLVLIGGDTLVYFRNIILGKPKDEQDCFKTLKKIQGKTNQVYSSLCVLIKKDNNISREICVTKTNVKMKKMSDKEIKEYVSTGEPLDKAGSYAIQGIGAKYIENYRGNYSSVVGLNTDKLKEIFEKYNILKQI